jgi:hypothetical protein
MTLIIPMTQKQLDRYDIIKRLIRKEINGAIAANLLGLSARHTKRLKAKVLDQGAAALQHGNIGRSSHNRLPDKERTKIIKLLHKHYYDFGPTLACEKLDENHDIKRDIKTIRQILIDEGLWKLKRKKEKEFHRSWRQRKAAYGEMIQFDGSYEHWFEDRNGSGELCLLAAIDDATGIVVQARFGEHEGVLPVMAFWREYLLASGRPRSIYLDKFSTYSMNQPIAKENPDTLTQFQRAMSELHIEVIPANSPQAKGRVERLFKTLQDRLIKELRLNNISTIERADEFLKIYLPKFNAKFAVKPRSKANLHKKPPIREQNKLNSILSRQTQRTVQNDFTLSFKKQWYQLTKEQPATVCKRNKVIFEERTDNTIQINLRGKYLNYKLLPARPVRLKAGKRLQPWVLAKTKERTNRSKSHKPSANHPWKQAFNVSVIKH